MRLKRLVAAHQRKGTRPSASTRSSVPTAHNTHVTRYTHTLHTPARARALSLFRKACLFVPSSRAQVLLMYAPVQHVVSWHTYHVPTPMPFAQLSSPVRHPCATVVHTPRLWQSRGVQPPNARSNITRTRNCTSAFACTCTSADGIGAVDLSEPVDVYTGIVHLSVYTLCAHGAYAAPWLGGEAERRRGKEAERAYILYAGISIAGSCDVHGG